MCIRRNGTKERQKPKSEDEPCSFNRRDVNRRSYMADYCGHGFYNMLLIMNNKKRRESKRFSPFVFF
jgi:hypothetical protein